MSGTIANVEDFTAELIDAIMGTIDGLVQSLEDTELTEMREKLAENIATCMAKFAGDADADVEVEPDVEASDEEKPAKKATPKGKSKAPAKGKKPTPKGKAPAKGKAKKPATKAPAKGKKAPAKKAPVKGKAKAPVEEEDELEVSKMTVVQLKAKCKEMKIKFDPKAKKADLVALLEGGEGSDAEVVGKKVPAKGKGKGKAAKQESEEEASDAEPALDAGEDSEAAPSDDADADEDLEKLTLAELKARIDKLNVGREKDEKLAKKGNKAELVARVQGAEALLEADEPSEE